MRWLSVIAGLFAALLVASASASAQDVETKNDKPTPSRESMSVQVDDFSSMINSQAMGR
jgi:hypothetical protein